MSPWTDELKYERIGHEPELSDDLAAWEAEKAAMREAFRRKVAARRRAERLNVAFYGLVFLFTFFAALACFIIFLR